jgi:hypothetical protein
MIRMEIHCPLCHHTSGNALTVDWPWPMEARCYSPLICLECGVEFKFEIDYTGMRTTGQRGQLLLDEFLKRRPYRPKVRS